MMNKLVSRFKKMTKGSRPVSDDVRFHNWMYKDENLSFGSEFRLNVSPVSEKDRFERIKIRALEDQKSRKEEEVKKIVFENKSVNKTQATCEDCVKSNEKSNSNVDFSRTERVDSGEWRKLKNKKMNEIMLRNEKKQRKCVRNRKKSTQESKVSKVNAYTPRTVSRMECRIKVIEDMKRARTRMNKEREVKDAFRTYVDSFAILKCSFDPQQDFRESMMEMIMENGIKQREELEELLACYLTLNCDDYHHLIVKVFKKVWLELNQANFDPYL